jgi:hypothetical protein
MTCNAQARDDLRDGARALRECDAVVSADVFAPEHGPRKEWTLEVLLAAETEGVPNPVLSKLAAAGLDLAALQAQGPYPLVVATA